ncbi:MAG: hypothetical protein IT314_12350 [Anaerolineales bacterium]|nr:hypothetical protein [Anaerolineales bacterium]
MNKNLLKTPTLKENLLRFRMWIGALLLRKEYEVNPVFREFNSLDGEEFNES